MEEKLQKFKELLKFYNNQFNLTAITSDEEIEIKHFEDSIFGEKWITKGAKLLDVGSGGGFPSIPLKIVREDIDMTLLEATGKKCTYLEIVAKELELKNLKVVNGRAEEMAFSSMRESYDFVTARAVARLNVLVEYCLPFVKLGGKMIAYKGDIKEVEEAKNAIKVLGGEIEEVVEYNLSKDMGKRCLVIIKKVSLTDKKYPRSNGKIKKKAL